MTQKGLIRRKTNQPTNQRKKEYSYINANDKQLFFQATILNNNYSFPIIQFLVFDSNTNTF